MRLHRDERGQTLILVALSLPFMLGFVGMATDVGALFKVKRTIQTAADAAAIAGALNYNRGYAAWTTAAQSAATANGFNYQSTGVTVTLPPTPTWQYSNYKGQTGYVEATITKTESTIFLTLFGYPSVTVLARAVATNLGSGTGCIYTTGATGTTLTLSGTLNASTCGVVVESNDPSAMVASGTSTFASVGVVGGFSGSGVDPTPVTGIAPDSDPLNYLPQYIFGGNGPNSVDCASGYDCANSPVGVPTTCATNGAGGYRVAPDTTLSPGCYVRLTFPSTGTVTVSPGEYIVQGDLTFAAGNVTGSGVTFYYSGNLTFGTGTYTLSAPNDPSQLFNGILFAESLLDSDTFSFNPATNPASVMKGVFYAPGTAVTLAANPPFTLDPSFVVQSLTIGGPVTFTNYGSLPGIQSPLTSVTLVE